MKRPVLLILLVLVFPLVMKSQFTVGTGGDVATLSEAFWAINNSGDDLGDVTLEIISDITETATAVLLPSGWDNSAFYSSITVFTNIAGLTIAGDFNGSLIDIAGAANLTIDGTFSGAADLTLSNPNTGSSASVVRFSGGAHDNTITNCNIRGSGQGAATGVLLFATESSGSGNNDNFVVGNHITGCNGNRPTNVIYSAGASGFENTGNTVRDNYIFDFLRTDASSNGIQLGSYNDYWVIEGNSFYETASFTPSGNYIYNVIYLNNSGSGSSITGNFIGGSSPSCGGTWTKTNSYNSTFTAININAGSGTATSLQDNLISKFNWANPGAAGWTGIEASAGTVNIGTETGNVIGATSGTGSILVTNGAIGSVYGITLSGSSAADCRNNTIGSITTASSVSSATNFYGILRSSTGSTTISSNTLGHETTANSINASSTSSTANQWLFGISNTGTGNLVIDGNLIANLNNSTTRTSTLLASGKIQGIFSSAGNNTISDNIIHDLKVACANTNSVVNTSVSGIVMTSTGTNDITGNTIYKLSNSFSSFTGYVTGIFAGATSCNNTISRNFIYSLSVTGASSIAATLSGIRLATGGSVTIENNIIALEIDKSANLVGIYEPGTSGASTRIYFNSVHIGGTVPSGLSVSYALHNTANSSSRNIRNNIFENKRMTDGGSNRHFAAYFEASGGTITCDFNDYFVSDAEQGGILGYYASATSILPIVTGQDGNSYNEEPFFASGGGTSPADYTIGADLIGINGTGITTDYGNITRVNPTMGAWERALNEWLGNTSTAWNFAGNWSQSVVPLENSSITFSSSAQRNLVLNTNHSVRNIINQTSYQVVTNNYQLTIKGTVDGVIDATTSTSTISYAGTTAQTLNATNFVSSKAANMIINNPAGVTLNSDFTIDNDLTINPGSSLTIPPARQLTVTGTLTNNAGITGLRINSDASGDAKLINNTADVPATVQLYLTGGLVSPGVGTFHYIIPPVENKSIGSTVIDARTNLGITCFNGDLLSFNESASVGTKNQGWQYFHLPPSPFPSLTSARGYNLYLNCGSDVLNFDGMLNAAEHNFNLSYTTGNAGAGWNLVGNPYPCNYNLNGVEGLGTVVEGISNTVYYNNNGTYTYWNVYTNEGSSGYTDVVPPMTGFFVKVTQPMSLTLPVASKTGSTSDTRTLHKGSGNKALKNAVKSEEEFQLPIVRLTLSKGAKSDETLVLLLDDATTSYNEHYDAFKLFAPSGSTSPVIHSRLNSVDYFMKAVKGPEEGQVVIPLRITVKEAGEHTISITELENIHTKAVLKHGLVERELTGSTVYTFTSGPGTFTDFELILGETGVATDIDYSVETSFKTWYNNGNLYVNFSDKFDSQDGEMIITDFNGRQLHREKIFDIVPGQTYQFGVVLHRGVYMIEARAGRSKINGKIVVQE